VKPSSLHSEETSCITLFVGNLFVYLLSHVPSCLTHIRHVFLSAIRSFWPHLREDWAGFKHFAFIEWLLHSLQLKLQFLFTFRGQCIVIYSYNKSQRAALFLNFICKELWMFRTDLLSIIRSLNTVIIAIIICRTSHVDCLLADSQHNYKVVQIWPGLICM